MSRPVVALSLATAFGVGYVPFAPGTFGSAVGLLLWAVLPQSVPAQGAAIVVLFAVGCWAGTVNEDVALKIKVRRVARNGKTVAMAWAPVTESFVRPMERVRRGVLLSGDVLACNLG